MVIERFKGGDPVAVGERFRGRGRLIPEGVELTYVSSWMCADGTACYQLMEAAVRSDLDDWIRNWQDLVDFEVIEVRTSARFWEERTHGA